MPTLIPSNRTSPPGALHSSEEIHDPSRPFGYRPTTPSNAVEIELQYSGKSKGDRELQGHNDSLDMQLSTFPVSRDRILGLAKPRRPIPLVLLVPKPGAAEYRVWGFIPFELFHPQHHLGNLLRVHNSRVTAVSQVITVIKPP